MSVLLTCRNIANYSLKDIFIIQTVFYHKKRLLSRIFQIFIELLKTPAEISCGSFCAVKHRGARLDREGVKTKILQNSSSFLPSHPTFVASSPQGRALSESFCYICIRDFITGVCFRVWRAQPFPRCLFLVLLIQSKTTIHTRQK